MRYDLQWYFGLVWRWPWLSPTWEIKNPPTTNISESAGGCTKCQFLNVSPEHKHLHFIQTSRSREGFFFFLSQFLWFRRDWEGSLTNHPGTKVYFHELSPWFQRSLEFHSKVLSGTDIFTTYTLNFCDVHASGEPPTPKPSFMSSHSNHNSVCGGRQKYREREGVRVRERAGERERERETHTHTPNKPLSHLHNQLVLKEKPSQALMSPREKQQTQLDTEVARHAG